MYINANCIHKLYLLIPLTAKNVADMPLLSIYVTVWLSPKLSDLSMDHFAIVLILFLKCDLFMPLSRNTFWSVEQLLILME